MRGAICMVVAALLLAACGSGEPRAEGPGSKVRLLKADTQRIASPDTTEGRVARLVRGNNDFAFDLYRAEAGEDNLIFSPYSISLAFSMAYAGARDETEAQMAETLHFLPQEEQHPAFNSLERVISDPARARSEGSGTPFRLNVANAAWGKRDYHFEQAYLETLSAHYGAGLRKADFEYPEKAAGEINEWIADSTEGRIEDLVPPDAIDPVLTRLILTNAVYFKASWLYPFEKATTGEGPFTIAGGEKVDVPMMRQTEEFPYTEGDGYQAIQLPYEGERADMLVILPSEGGFGSVEDRLDAGFLEGVRRGLKPRGVELTMPRFDFETDLDLKERLRSMGLKLPFDDDVADFGGITQEEHLYVSDALHKATVTVDEKGTEAAAATAVIMQAESGGPIARTKMTLDRPFVFAVVERETGTILFLGHVTNPRE
jgi:serpin B